MNKKKITPFKLKTSCEDNVPLNGQYSFYQLQMAFEAGRAFNEYCDKAGKIVELTREQLEQYLKYSSFSAWAEKENLH